MVSKLEEDEGVVQNGAVNQATISEGKTTQTGGINEAIAHGGILVQRGKTFIDEIGEVRLIAAKLCKKVSQVML